jgi:hypothetical protein
MANRTEKLKTLMRASWRTLLVSLRRVSARVQAGLGIPARVQPVR